MLTERGARDWPCGGAGSGTPGTAGTAVMTVSAELGVAQIRDHGALTHACGAWEGTSGSGNRTGDRMQRASEQRRAGEEGH